MRSYRCCWYASAQLDQKDVKNYMAHSELADKLGYVELKIKLEEMAADEAAMLVNYTAF